MNNSQGLTTARTNKKDEFYTSYEDIAAEVMSYPADTWKEKKIYLPCDDPESSMFWKFFVDHFEELGLREVSATHLRSDKLYTYLGRTEYDACFLEEELGHVGDFRLCKDLMKDKIVITNPPFSLFREFMSQLREIGADFLILGNINAVTNKDIFNDIKEEKIRLGKTIHSGDREFRVPDDYPLEAAGVDIRDGQKYIRVKGVRWFSTLKYDNDQWLNLRIVPSKEWQWFDNYPAINVGKTKDIPINYLGVAGVPITFLDKWNPRQFEILGMDVNMPDNPRKNKRFLYKGKETYARIMIKRIKGRGKDCLEEGVDLEKDKKEQALD